MDHFPTKPPTCRGATDLADFGTLTRMRTSVTRARIEMDGDSCVVLGQRIGTADKHDAERWLNLDPFVRPSRRWYRPHLGAVIAYKLNLRHPKRYTVRSCALPSCRADFFGYHSARFCSSECLRAHRAAYQAVANVAAREKRQGRRRWPECCDVCHRRVELRRSSRRYCSDACRQRAYRARATKSRGELSA